MTLLGAVSRVIWGKPKSFSQDHSVRAESMLAFPADRKPCVGSQHHANEAGVTPTGNAVNSGLLIKSTPVSNSRHCINGSRRSPEVQPNASVVRLSRPQDGGISAARRKFQSPDSASYGLLNPSSMPTFVQASVGTKQKIIGSRKPISNTIATSWKIPVLQTSLLATSRNPNCSSTAISIVNKRGGTSRHKSAGVPKLAIPQRSKVEQNQEVKVSAIRRSPRVPKPVRLYAGIVPLPKCKRKLKPRDSLFKPKEIDDASPAPSPVLSKFRKRKIDDPTYKPKFDNDELLLSPALVTCKKRKVVGAPK